MLDVRGLFDNKKDSDYTITLANGQTIAAHRLVLRIGSTYHPHTTNIFALYPSHAARDAIRFIYGHDIGVSKLSSADWADMIRIATDQSILRLTDELCSNPPPSITTLNIIATAHRMNSKRMLDIGIQAIIGAGPLIPNMLSGLSKAAYDWMRGRWVELSHSDDPSWSTFMLLNLDCRVWAYKSDTPYPVRLLQDIQFSKFTPAELTAAADFPGLAKIPWLQHMLQCMASLADPRGLVA